MWVVSGRPGDAVVLWRKGEGGDIAASARCLGGVPSLGGPLRADVHCEDWKAREGRAYRICAGGRTESAPGTAQPWRHPPGTGRGYTRTLRLAYGTPHRRARYPRRLLPGSSAHPDMLPPRAARRRPRCTPAASTETTCASGPFVACAAPTPRTRPPWAPAETACPCGGVRVSPIRKPTSRLRRTNIFSGYMTR